MSDIFESSPDAATTEAAAAMPDSVEGLRAEVGRLRTENARLEKETLRQIAEVRNIQQRLQREKSEALRYAAAEIVQELLVVIDDLDRSLEAVGNGADAAALAEGVRIVNDHFMKILKSRGVEAVPAAGQTFDPAMHEALMQQPSAEAPAGQVIQEVQKGYRMHDRVLRPARVIVSSGAPS
ncbi:MAG: nucleotide exchange factor GrpE [Phycisphaerales bacterium]|nr:nucleotide exchange factor GrpE [Phycisphaerales bacterium]